MAFGKELKDVKIGLREILLFSESTAHHSSISDPAGLTAISDQKPGWYGGAGSRNRRRNEEENIKEDTNRNGVMVRLTFRFAVVTPG